MFYKPIMLQTLRKSPESAEPLTPHPRQLAGARPPSYTTKLGAAYTANGLAVMMDIPPASVDAIITSPPYALEFKKEYGNVAKEKYVEWFLPFASEIKRILKPEGSFVLNIGGSYNSGSPTRSIYHFKLLIALCDQIGFHLAQECFWYNPAKLPAPAEWVNVRRCRIKDSVEYVWWLSPSQFPKANNRAYRNAEIDMHLSFSEDMIRLEDFLELIGKEGHFKLAGMLERGTI